MTNTFTATLLVIMAIVLIDIYVDAKETSRVKRCVGSSNNKPATDAPTQKTTIRTTKTTTTTPRPLTAHEKYNEGWPEECSTGKRQSPINLVRSSAKERHEDNIIFHRYNDVHNVEMLNDGHSVKLRFKRPVSNLEDDRLPYITFSGAEYDLDSIHYHWDAEHTINDYRYPLESHFVHYSHNYSNFNDALKHGVAVVILAVMYEIEEVCLNNIFDSIVGDIKKISRNYTPYAMPNPIGTFIFDNLLATNTNNYYLYNGSLTTPKCDEGAQWIVFDTPSCIERTEMSELINIYMKDEKLASKNYRYLQELHNRDVFYVSSETDDSNSTEIV